jgi:hypothetical protein
LISGVGNECPVRGACLRVRPRAGAPGRGPDSGGRPPGSGRASRALVRPVLPGCVPPSCQCGQGGPGRCRGQRGPAPAPPGYFEQEERGASGPAGGQRGARPPRPFRSIPGFGGGLAWGAARCVAWPRRDAVDRRGPRAPPGGRTPWGAVIPSHHGARRCLNRGSCGCP